MAESNMRSTSEKTDKIDPARASAAVKRWRRAVAKAMGQDPGAALDQPDRRLVMMRVFGSTRRLAELCMSYPDAAASALIDGASAVLAENARDLASLDLGVGGPDALHAAIAPLKNRADLAIALAELDGDWSVGEATAARVDFAERLLETALKWLVRSAVNRGELNVKDAENAINGIFAVAGGDCAHEDLCPYGPLDLIIVYDDQVFSSGASRGADRVFVRIGAEIREAFEGKPGEHTIFALRTPLGSGVGGAGYASSASNIIAAAQGPQAHALKAWLATARIVAGDRSAGGDFLEKIENIVWSDAPILDGEMKTALSKDASDPRAAYQRVADLCRLAIGGRRPLFRTSSANQIFETAARSRIMTQDAARRLRAGEEFAHMAVSRTQMIKGSAAIDVAREDEQMALARLCNFSDYGALVAALEGARVDARNTLERLFEGPQNEVALYTGESEEGEDADKLEDLGFLNGASLSLAIDEWAKRVGASGDARFSAHAPGLLTEIGETQRPNLAVRLFDALLEKTDKHEEIFAALRNDNRRRDAIVDAFGCFGAALAPLIEREDAFDALFDEAGEETPQSGHEWLKRYPAPSLAKANSLDELAAWRKQLIARIAFEAVSGATSFDAAATALDAVQIRTLGDVFDFAAGRADKAESSAAAKITLHVFDGAGPRLPGAATYLGFIATEDLGEDGEAFARRYLSLLEKLGEGIFAVSPDLSHRPGGPSGALVPDIKTFKAYVQSEAVAHEQVMLARARVIAGDSKAMTKARNALRGAVSSGRRCDILFRDLDRARAQRMRRERPTSDWDIDRLEGGRIDVELIISTLVFKHAAAHPFVQESDAGEALDAMARSGLISEEAAQSLKAAREFWARLQVARAFAQWSDPVSAPVRRRFGNLIARAAGVDKFEQVRPLIRGYSDDVTRLYAQIVLGRPALSTAAPAAG